MESIFSIFEKYGWPGIIGLLLCVIIFIGAKWIGKKLSKDMTNGFEKVGEKLTNQMSEQNSKLMDVIVSQQDKLLNNIIDSRTKEQERHTDMMIDKIKLSEEIIDMLKTIMYSHHSQRAFILEFHNSYQNLTGVPFAKYSCTYEWFDKGMTSLANSCIGLAFSQIAPIVSEVLKEDSHQKTYSNMNDVAEYSPALLQLIQSEQNVKQIVYTAMFDNHNIPIGLLVLEYTISYNLSEEELNLLKIQAAEITSIINIRYKYENNE